MRMPPTVFMLACCLVGAGCSESTMIRSYPMGSKVYVNGSFAGVTPLPYQVEPSKFSTEDFTVRLEHPGYSDAQGTLRKQSCPGRIVGGVFTLGILFIFKGPTCFSSPQDFWLEPVAGQAASDSGVPHQPTIDERLERIRRMRDDGTITNEEYEHYRKEILKDL